MVGAARKWRRQVLYAHGLVRLKPPEVSARAAVDGRLDLPVGQGHLQAIGNTPAVCRRCHVHPDVLNAHLDGTLRLVLEQQAGRRLAKKPAGLTRHEAAVLALLTRRLAEGE